MRLLRGIDVATGSDRAVAPGSDSGGSNRPYMGAGTGKMGGNVPRYATAASSFGMPTIRITRLRLYASTVRLNSACTFSSPRRRK